MNRKVKTLDMCFFLRLLNAQTFASAKAITSQNHFRDWNCCLSSFDLVEIMWFCMCVAFVWNRWISVEFRNKSMTHLRPFGSFMALYVQSNVVRRFATIPAIINPSVVCVAECVCARKPFHTYRMYQKCFASQACTLCVCTYLTLKC